VVARQLLRDDPAVAAVQVVRRVQLHRDSSGRVLHEEDPARREDLAVPREEHLVVAMRRKLREPGGGEIHRPVARGVGVLDVQRREGARSLRGPDEVERVPAREAAGVAVAREVAAEEGHDEDQHGRGEQRDAALDPPAARSAERHREGRPALHLRRQLRRRPGGDEQIVHVLQPLALLVAEIDVDELVEVRRPRHASSSPSRTPARRDSALRVRVFTVPSGMCRNSATSLCDRPLQ
jgi:hypothetical protein